MREKLSLDKGWKFYLGDPKVQKAIGHQAIYMASKAERGRGFASKDYYDGDWEDITLPHDYQILGDYDTALEGSHGYLPRNNAWYRRSFYLNEGDRHKRITLIFDGIASHATIWVNGHLMERNFCGYNAFEIDITDVVLDGNEANTIAVRVEANDEVFEGWWYEGAGIYRHVWLQKTANIALATWGIHVDPIKDIDHWTVPIEVRVVNRQGQEGTIGIIHELMDPFDELIALTESVVDLDGQGHLTQTQVISIDQPKIWDLSNPALYKVVTSLKENGKIIDATSTSFGFRSLRFDADEGFFLNEIQTKVKGVCGHQDHGGLGVALPEQVWELRIKKLKAMGCNAYRCGHTPPPTEFLNLCDRYGLLVMDECRWFESSRIGQRQLENMLIKDRNHPSVFMWSIGNEEPIQSTDVGERVATTNKRFVKSFDQTRPVTVALNGGFYDSKVSKASDVIGINYNFAAYDKAKELLPDHPICSPEVGATSNCRSTYFDEGEKGRFVSYDEVAAPFGSTHRKAWEEVVKRDFVFGMFVWTGFEYRGESTWPKLFAGGGALDSSGYEKDNYHLFRALWQDQPMVHVMPHWNLAVEEGTPIKVMTYTNCEEVELYLNEVSLGRRTNDPIWQLEWMVPYKEGCLKAVGYQEGKVIVTDEKNTLTGPYHLEIRQTDTGDYSIDQSTLVFDVAIKDNLGRLATHLDSEMTFDLQGLTLLGTGNGDPADHDHNRRSHRRIFRGLCQVICRVDGHSDDGIIKASAPDYGQTKLKVRTRGLKTYPKVSLAKKDWKISQWWKSPLQTQAIDLEQEVATGDVNSWEPVALTKGLFKEEMGYRHYYISTKIPSFNDGQNQAYLKLSGICGELMFRVEHNPNYWPNPKPKSFKKIHRSYKTAVQEDLIPLEGFAKDEAVVLHLVTGQSEHGVSAIDSVAWVIQPLQ